MPPNRAAVTAQLAVAIAILSAAPVRLANLTAIRLGTNLIKPGGPTSNYWLVFPDYDVKNRVRLEYPLEPYLTQLIDEYVHDFRPALLRGRNEDWLFPGQRGGCQGQDLVQRSNHRAHLQGDGPADDSASIPTRRRCHHSPAAGRASTSWSGDCSATAACRPRSIPISAWRTSRRARSSARS